MLYYKMAEASGVLDIDIKNVDGLLYLDTIPDGSIDLILTDPPYIISKETGMNAHYNTVKQNEKDQVEFVKTEEEWLAFAAAHPEKVKEEKVAVEPGKKLKTKLTPEQKKINYRKYGTILGKKYCVKTDYGEWDRDFTMEKLEQFIAAYYKKLRVGGTLILFFDLWKVSYLKELLEKHKFKQIRFIEWIKTNPQPLNSGTNYLTNCREIALLGVKGGKPTFNSKYDNGLYKDNDVYMFPLQGGKNRFHPTQKSLSLFEELIKKHSNENDIVLDTFLGGGTTALACKNTKRRFRGCELSKEYVDRVLELLK